MLQSFDVLCATTNLNKRENQDCRHYFSEFYFSRCLNIDEKERWSASQLLKHPFLVVLNLGKSNIAVANAESANEHEEADKAADEYDLLRTLNEFNIPNKTRLVTDFEILDSLGQGGFGSVIKVRCKLVFNISSNLSVIAQL